jgi:hypothetical protein
MAIDKALYKDKRLTESEKKKIKPANQGGGPNYLGKQETVTVPKKWLSDPDHVVAELAYITPKEQKILLDANLYGSLKGKPNRGPGGIMSLQGDLGGYSASTGGKSGDSSGKGGGGSTSYKDTNYYQMMTGTGTTATSPTGDTYRSNKVAQGAVPEYVSTPQGTQYVGSQFKSYGQPSFFGDLFSGGASGYRGTYGTRPNFFQRAFGFGNQMGSINTRVNPNTGQLEYYSEDERVGDVKPGLLESLSNFGIMGVLKNLFKKPSMYEDMSQYNRLGLGGVDPVLTDTYSDMKISDTSFSPNVNIPTVPNFINPPGQIDDTGIQYSVPSADPKNYDFTGFEDAMAKLNQVEQRAYDTLKMGKDLGMNTEEQNKQLEELEKKKNEAGLITGLA